VARELDPVFAKQVLSQEVLLPECLQFVGLIDRREPHLIAKDDQEVRAPVPDSTGPSVVRFGLGGCGFAARWESQRRGRGHGRAGTFDEVTA
jgi:hypothetical protein